jgi:hypothetical protein
MQHSPAGRVILMSWLTVALRNPVGLAIGLVEPARNSAVLPGAGTVSSGGGGSTAGGASTNPGDTGGTGP